VRCFIFGAGEFKGTGFPCPSVNDLVIAADGGLAYAESMGINPSVVLGDFDSLGRAPAGDYETLTFPPEKDYTDLMLAAEEGFNRGARTFYLLGATGGRMDHTLANIQVVVNLTRRGCKVYLIGNDYWISAVHNGKIELASSLKGYFSLYSFSEYCKGVSVKGAKYQVEDFNLRQDDPRAISNEFTGEACSVSVEDGTLLLCIGDLNGI